EGSKLRQAIQDSPRVVILCFKPRDDLGTLGVLEPTVWIGDRGAEVLLLHFAHGRLRESRRGSVCGPAQATDEKDSDCGNRSQVPCLCVIFHDFSPRCARPRGKAAACHSFRPLATAISAEPIPALT